MPDVIKDNVAVQSPFQAPQPMMQPQIQQQMIQPTQDQFTSPVQMMGGQMNGLAPSGISQSPQNSFAQNIMPNAR